MEIKKVDKQFLLDLLDDTDANGKFNRIGLFYAEETTGINTPGFTAIDNSTGDAWAEHFPTEQQAIDYLNSRDGEELIPEEEIQDDQEIRLAISKLDGEAGNIIDMITDKYSSVPENPDLYAFLDIMTNLQDQITELQERMSWI